MTLFFGPLFCVTSRPSTKKKCKDKVQLFYEMSYGFLLVFLFSFILFYYLKKA